MDIEKYRVLKEAINMGSLSAAADKLGYTPSGISRLISNLEKENGFPLLVRNKHGVTPTDECIKLMPQIEHLIQSSENLSQLSAQICGVELGTITVGSSYGIYYQWLARVIHRFNEKHPSINFVIVEGTSTTLGKMVEKGQADFCIISKRKGDFNWFPLMEDELVVWVPEKHPSIECGFFNQSDLEKEPLIELFPGGETDNSIFFKEKSLIPNNKYSTADIYAAYSLVEAGLGVSLTNKLLATNIKGNVKSVPLKPSQQISIGIATAKEDIISPATRTFVEFAKGFMSELE